MKCPVCDKRNTSMLCPKCGFDSSRDYGKYPTFGTVERAPAVSALRKQWQEKQNSVEPAPPKPEPPVIPDPPKKKNKLLPFLIAAAFALTLGLGVWIGTGMGGGKPLPSEPGESVQMREPVVTTTGPVESVQIQVSPETTIPTESESVQSQPSETSESVQSVQMQEPPETTKPTASEPVQSQSTEPKETEATVLTLDPNDVTSFSLGESFTIYVQLGSSSISRSKVNWTTSDPKVATVEEGVVTTVGKGTATITAVYEGKKSTCIVRCKFEDPSNQENPTSLDWKASHSDVLIAEGESFRLTVKNSAGETADVIWTMSVEGIVSVEGNVVTGHAPGTVTLVTEIDGITLKCIVRVV